MQRTVAPATRQGFERLHLEVLAKVNRSKELDSKMIMPTKYKATRHIRVCPM